MDTRENRFFSVVYKVKCDKTVSPEKVARDISEEQTVEIPHDYIPERIIKNGISGIVQEITPSGARNTYLIEIAYRNDLTAFSASQFLNILFGNISLKKGIKIIDLKLSAKLIREFGGPGYGIDKIREITGIYKRPLVATALKPAGLSCSEFVKIAKNCAAAGIDIIKDDHGITDQSFHPYEDRVERVNDIITEENIKRGGNTLYFPNISGDFDTIKKKVEFAIKRGIRGFLVMPQLMGFDLIKFLYKNYNAMIMAHPSFTGSFFSSKNYGIRPETFLGTIFRLLGADISIFPSFGGRFPFTKKQCLGIAAELTTDKLPTKKAFPAPAGGITRKKIADIAESYGSDAVLLIGGNLLYHSKDLYKSAFTFMEEIRKIFGEMRKYEKEMPTSCDFVLNKDKLIKKELLKFSNYEWSGRYRTTYKTENQDTFADITRTELIGKGCSDTSFDLRYFEIACGGFSSLEKHMHEHVIIGVRGQGVLIKENSKIIIKPNDIAYVGRFETHQLRNECREPFGFYCIVDRVRDRPVSVA